MRFRFIDASRADWPVRALCRNLGVTAAGYYAWRGRPPSARAEAAASLAAEARAAFAEAKGRYGSPRLHRALRARGVECGVNAVARVMKSLGLAAARPDEKWVSDFTYVPTGEGWLYLAAVEDLYSRRIVGWAMGASPDSALTARALGMAVAHRRPGPGLLVHSDRGCQYTSAEYRSAAAGHGAAQSFSRRGNCWDNAPMESFFASLKKELVYRESFATRAAAERAIFEYVEVFYNRVRLHSKLGYVAPATFESSQT